MRWCDHHDVGYILGLARNSRLVEAAAPLLSEAEALFEQTGGKQRLFGEARYAAATWDRERRVIVKAERLEKGANPRFVVTNIEGEPTEIYERYCARGEMENRIKEQQLCLFADRTSCSRWLPNQFRVLLSGLAYTLLTAIRRLGLAGTDMARARCNTIRLKLLKIGAAVIRNTRRVRFLLSGGYPYRNLFLATVSKLCPD